MSDANLYTFENPEFKKTYWHTCSHVLAQAMKRLHPEVKLAIGPAIENGFYYDFDTPEPFSETQLAELEAEMRKICKEKLKLERFELPRAEAIQFMEEKGEPYKVELIHDLPEDATISFYKHPLYERFMEACRARGFRGEHGQFGADIDIGIPQQPGHQVRPQFAEFTAFADIALLKLGRHAVANEILHVRLQRAQVRIRGHQIRKLNHVIPHQDAFGDFPPLLEIGAERPAGRIGFDRPMAVALDVAQHDIDVVGRANSFRGRTTVTVGKRRNHFVREPGGHAVGESDDRTARSAGLLVQLPAGGTGAVIAVLGIGVVLTDRPIKGVGLLAHPVAEVFDDRLQHVRVGQAQLRAKVTVGLHADPFAVDITARHH